jgi:hypothetical protein
MPHGDVMAGRQFETSRSIKKTNSCREHGITLNQLLPDANRKKEPLIMTAIEFTDAFGSLPNDLICRP